MTPPDPASLRLEDIIASTAPHGTAALVRVFADDDLARLGAGATSGARLDWLFAVTRGREGQPAVPGLQMKIDFGDDADLAAQFRDSQFYPRWPQKGGKPSNQVGHFLTAVALAYYPAYDLFDVGLRLMIGHEKSSDEQGRRPDAVISLTQMLSVTPADLAAFREALALDVQADEAAGEARAALLRRRDERLWSILQFGPGVAFGDVAETRSGNSLPDLRLSLAGCRFARWVLAHGDTPPGDAARWLRAHLLFANEVPSGKVN